jgi:hypothetical protein
MATRTFVVIDVVEVLTQWYAGRPVARVARSLGVDPRMGRGDLAGFRCGNGSLRSLGVIHGLAGYTAMLRVNIDGALTQMHLTAHDTIEAGQKVGLRFTDSGARTGPFLGVAPTRRHADGSASASTPSPTVRITAAWFAEAALPWCDCGTAVGQRAESIDTREH